MKVKGGMYRATKTVTLLRRKAPTFLTRAAEAVNRARRMNYTRISRYPVKRRSSMRATMLFPSGYMSSYDQSDPDHAEMILEFRDASDAVIGSYSTGSVANISGWVHLLTPMRRLPAQEQYG
ncbi:MAG: hypothetical protein QM664_06300 [Flavihumibacter sp.]